MSKKIAIISLIIVIAITITILIIFVFQNKKTITKVKDNICNISTFTITDNGTEIDVTINNQTSKNINLNKVTVELYDSNNKKIKTINKKIEKKVKTNGRILIQINEKEKYSSTANIKCLLYQIN